jgi:enterochelin esterase family protein
MNMRNQHTVALMVAGFLLVCCPIQSLCQDSNRRDPQPQIRYPLEPDSLPNESVPKGKLEGPFLFQSEIIEDTTRKYWVYVPAQYDASEAACVLVFQDGARAINPNGDLRVPQVLENLIAKKQIPVTIGIFITPGHRGNEYPESIGTGNPDNRADEYDVLDDGYARMLIEEILPEVGKKYNLTDDPGGRAIGGSSSGGICAFTVAWQRPDEFRNVISLIGSYTNIRGGHVYPDLVREAEKKPIRIFLQDGENDLVNQFGSWFEQNQKMVAALQEKNYDMAYVFGKGGHSDDHGGAMLPLMLRWIWRDYPGIEPPTTDLVAQASAIEPETVELFPGYDATAQVDPSGSYEWENRFGRMVINSRLEIARDGDALSGKLEVIRDGEEPTVSEILNPVLEGNKLIFDVKSTFRGQEFTSTYQGIVSDRGISGWRLMTFGGQPRDMRWTAEKE